MTVQIGFTSGLVPGSIVYIYAYTVYWLSYWSSFIDRGTDFKLSQA